MKLITTKYRGKVAENCHIANAVAVNSKGEVLFTAGEGNFPAFMNQVADPFMTVCLLKNKMDEEYDLSEEELAVLTSMHRGEDKFTKSINSVLNKIDVKPKELLCPDQKPEDNSSYERLIIQGKRPTQIHNPSSGVHAGMIGLEKMIEESVGSYNSFNHPVQTQYLENIKEYADTENVYREVDDNGIPTFSLPLQKIARIYSLLIKKDDQYLRKVANLIMNNVGSVYSSVSFDYEFTKLLKGKAIARSNKNGLQLIGIETGSNNFVGVAVKALSGNQTAASSMALEVLKHLKMISDAKLKKMKKFHTPEQKSKSGSAVLKMKSEITS